MVTAVKRQISKKTGKEYARLVLEDFHGTAEAIVFPEAWAKLNQAILPDAALLLTGGYSDRDRGEDRAPFIVESARPLAGARGDRGGGAEPAVAACRAAPPPDDGAGRRPALHRRTPARRRSILSGTTATASRCGSGRAASAWRSRKTSCAASASCSAPMPSTTPGHN